ncbi:hypothetical protein L6452_21874 [Arctium lappa]|uniref:Uncharacterized protein n=1 Tax=Arctium lappa TaxID=4217 RepID=A0ACB9AYH5_ARCLA|nr:hypothetical protein L6452_21874 [Arctium lappa]
MLCVYAIRKVVTDPKHSQAQLVFGDVLSIGPTAIVVAPSATIQVDSRTAEDVKEILPALANLTDEVTLIRSKVVDLQVVVYTLSTTASERIYNLQTKVNNIKADLLANTTLIYSLHQSFNKYVVDFQVDDEKEGEKDIAGRSQLTKIYENLEDAEDALIMSSSSVPVTATLMMPLSSVAKDTTSTLILDNYPLINDDDDDEKD